MKSIFDLIGFFIFSDILSQTITKCFNLLVRSRKEKLESLLKIL